MKSASRLTAVALAGALFLIQPASAWNFVTHRVIAAMAYDRLSPPARARVNALLKQHPDYASHFLKDAPADEPARSRAVFIAAAIWPDQIRNDPRFYNDAFDDHGVHEIHPTPTLPGFPDMKRHAGWHFTDLPFSQDGTPLVQPAIPNVVTELERIIGETGQGSEAAQVYNLPWLIHLAGDIHAPLHCVSRFSASLPMGDQGGNLVFVAPGITLHKFWDDGVGTDLSADFVDRMAKELLPPEENVSGQSPLRPLQKVLIPQSWAEESLSVAKKEIYTFGMDNGAPDRPLTLPPGYAAHAHKVAESQAVNAALRLAEVINQRLK